MDTLGCSGAERARPANERRGHDHAEKSSTVSMVVMTFSFLGKCDHGPLRLIAARFDSPLPQYTGDLPPQPCAAVATLDYLTSGVIQPRVQKRMYSAAQWCGARQFSHGALCYSTRTTGSAAAMEGDARLSGMHQYPREITKERV